jgi:hypothetical protein
MASVRAYSGSADTLKSVCTLVGAQLLLPGLRFSGCAGEKMVKYTPLIGKVPSPSHSLVLTFTSPLTRLPGLLAYQATPLLFACLFVYLHR